MVSLVIYVHDRVRFDVVLVCQLPCQVADQNLNEALGVHHEELVACIFEDVQLRLTALEELVCLHNLAAASGVHPVTVTVHEGNRKWDLWVAKLVFVVQRGVRVQARVMLMKKRKLSRRRSEQNLKQKLLHSSLFLWVLNRLVICNIISNRFPDAFIWKLADEREWSQLSPCCLLELNQPSGRWSALCVSQVFQVVWRSLRLLLDTHWREQHELLDVLRLPRSIHAREIPAVRVANEDEVSEAQILAPVFNRS
jgi:hypothetical protein